MAMNGREAGSADATRVAGEVSAFYERHPYPPPVDDLDRYRLVWDDRRRAEAHLFWPDEPYRDDRSILVAGCGTSQAAKYALRWPRASVTGIDVSATSIQRTEKLKRKYRLENLELHQLPVERSTELGRGFAHIVCTGVLHHLPDPAVSARSSRSTRTATPRAPSSSGSGGTTRSSSTRRGPHRTNPALRCYLRLKVTPIATPDRCVSKTGWLTPPPR